MERCATCGEVHPSGECLRATLPAPAAPPAATGNAARITANQVTQISLSQETIAPEHSLSRPPDELLTSVDLPTGAMVGEYQINGRLGEGGMGVVYAAVHPLIGRKVAIKVLNAAGAGAAGSAARFLQEARAATLVRHRNIVDVFAFGQLRDGRSYLVMEFLDGESLASFMGRCGPLSYARALPLLEGVCAGLKAAHDKGIIHRDLKPENIWLCPPDDASAGAHVVKLLDFGLAKLTQGDGANMMLTRAGAPLGTPAFMSPEQCRGVAEIDHRSDIYALGIIMYEMFTRDVPFDGPSFVEVLNLHLTALPRSLEERVGMPSELDDVVRRALEKDPADRWQTVGELRAALLEAGETSSAWAPPAGMGAAGTRAQQAQTLIAEEHAGDGRRRLASLEFGAFHVTPTFDGQTLLLRFRGELDETDAAMALGSWLGDLMSALGDAEIGRVVLDLSALDFLVGPALACLGDWLALLRDMRSSGLAPTTIRYRDTARWQQSAVDSLARVDPAVMLEMIEDHP